MRVVLHEAVDGVGSRGDIVDVADGFGRNLLIPKGLARQASPGVEAQAAAMKRAWQARNAKQREAAEEIAKILVAKTIEISARAGGGGKLFGSVTAADIAGAIKDQASIDIDRRMISMDEAIRTVGTHAVMLKPHSDVQFPVSVRVQEA